MELIYIISGFAVGVLVGLTGVGGGSLMTPLMIFAFNVQPIVAVGTDLLFAAITKTGGIISHNRRGTICWNIVGWMSLGSLPTAVVTVYVLDMVRTTNPDFHIDAFVNTLLGVALVLTALALYLKNHIHDSGQSIKKLLPNWKQWRTPVTILAGVLLGILVPITSIGAGAFGAAILLFLYPSLPTMRVVGTDLAHAVPLTALAGMGHMQMGTVDFTLLGYLLIGSLPGIYVGSHASTVIPEKLMRPILATMLLLIGLKFIVS
ncbi:MAG TPA: sulfite exporter TauE/SafE family protein [Chromatiales bacterium]|nr:sulfite exporter TauE/SafE family protein [Chromatiales bacterium]